MRAPHPRPPERPITTPRPSATPAADHTPAYDVATLENCEDEPIHVPGAIQPHGFLLAFDQRFVVTTASANLGALVGVTARAAIGQELAAVVGTELAQLVRDTARGELPHEPMSAVLHQVREGALARQRADVRVHWSDDRLVLEVEELVGSELRSPYRGAARSSLVRLASGVTTERLTELLAHEVRALTGFDRVMVYRFDEQWNGEVVAEDRDPGLSSFLGLHYPASDIPAQARQLYRVNPVRLIADVHYAPVPLRPTFDPETGDPLDLSHSVLRSVSPIHVEYLSNMGVTASMSLSILVDGELWGLVACHHYAGAHRPSHEARAAAEVVTQATAHLLGNRQRVEVREAMSDTRQLVADLTQRVATTSASPLDGLIADPALLEVFGATGAALKFDDDDVRTVGRTPPAGVLARIAALTDDPYSYVSSTQHLAGLDPALARLSDVAAGVLRIGSMDGRWLMWFRPEEREVVNWGGEPTDKQDADPAVRLSPRTSFEKWRQVVRGRSAPWRPWHLEGADVLGRNVNSMLLIRSREQIAMAESVQRTVVLDRAPEFNGVAVAARYHPASTYQLGGDWWDVFELGDQVALVVGDVAGHGVAAASAMTQLRTATRAYLVEGHRPADCLDLLDRLLDGPLDLGLATAVVATLDRGTGEVELASAGHPLPLLLPADGGARAVEADVRPMLGVGEGTACSVRLHLEPGDGLLLYSDGLVERRGTDLGERTERLRRLAGDRPPDGQLERWVDGLVTELSTTDTDGDTDDDATMLVVRRG